GDDYHRRLKALAVESGRPITFGVFGRRGVPGVWRKYMALLDETAAEGGRMFAQAHSRSLSALLSFKTQMPFDRLPLWKELRKLPLAEEDQDDALEIMKRPRACVTFSDSGAHVTQLMDSSLQTHLLAHWVRKKQAFTLPQAVRMLTLVPATLWGFADRGLVREGMAADFVVFDPESIGAEMPELVADLPAGAKRLV